MTSYVKDGFGTSYWRFRWSVPQDWSGFQRVAFMIRPSHSGLASYRPALALISREAPTQASDPLAIHYLPGLKPGEWNHVVWEFTELPRGQVVEFAILQALAGPPGLGVTYDIRDFVLEQVQPDRWGGWDMAPGVIAFNHSGYTPGAAKVAQAAPGDATFEMLDADTGRMVARLPATIARHRVGTFATLDFSAVSKPGHYRLRYGATTGKAFEIGARIADDLIDRLLNFFYADRCGCAVPGVHGICHGRLFAEHRGVRRSLNGGWHDAGNLCQGAYRTALATGALLTLYEAVRADDTGPRPARVLEEACWGLDWLLKTRFGGGYRAVNSAYTIMEEGTRRLADLVVPAENAVFESLMFAAVAGRAARLMADEDANRVAEALKAAVEDYADATAQFFGGAVLPPASANTPAPHQICAYGIEAALVLHGETREERYAGDAVRYARHMLALQDRRPVGELGVTGHFTLDERRERRVLEFHTSFADAPARALAQLCQALPNHADWPEWYAAAAFESECFQRRGAEIAAPFHHLPNGIWTKADVDACIQDTLRALPLGRLMGAEDIAPIPDENGVRADIHAEVAASYALADGHRLRTFPIARDRIFHGATTIQLAAACGLASSARLRRNPVLDRLARQQFDWVLGTNPFGASLVAGTGYDYESHMLMWSDDIVGALPVGMDSRCDAPFWPQTCHMTSREMWVVPAAKLALLIAELTGYAEIVGVARDVAHFTCRTTGQSHAVRAGVYRLSMPAGRYDLHVGGRQLRTVELFAGERQTLDIDPGRVLDAALLVDATIPHPRLVARLEGRGRHRLTMRGVNIVFDNAEKVVDLTGGKSVRTDAWMGRVTDPPEAWVAWLAAGDDPFPIADLVSPAPSGAASRQA